MSTAPTPLLPFPSWGEPVFDELVIPPNQTVKPMSYRVTEVIDSSGVKKSGSGER